MAEAKIGLVVVALIIIAFAIVMRTMGALRTATTVVAIVVTVAIAATLFLTQ